MKMNESSILLRSHGGTGGAELALLGLLREEVLVDVGDHTTTGDGGVNELIKLLITTNGKLQVARRDTLEVEILGGVAGKLEHLSREVLEDGRNVHGRIAADAEVVDRAHLKEAVHTAHRELIWVSNSPNNSTGVRLANVGRNRG